MSVRQVLQELLDKISSLSHLLHPVLEGGGTKLDVLVPDITSTETFVQHVPSHWKLLVRWSIFPETEWKVRAKSDVWEAGKSQRHRKRRVRSRISVFCNRYDCVSSRELHSTKGALLYSSLLGIITEETVKATKGHDKASSSCILLCCRVISLSRKHFFT